MMSAAGQIPQMVTECIALSTGVTVTVDRIGEGPVVLLLHGIGGNRGQWRGLMESLSDRFHMVAWDARGYGGSAGARVSDFVDFARDLEALMDALGMARVLAIGHSMGGRILLEAAAIMPGRFAGLMLVGTQPAYLKEMNEADRTAYIGQRAALFGEDGIRVARIPAIAASLVAANASREAVRATEAGLAALDRDGYLAALTSSIGMDKQDLLATLAMPVEVVGGGEDRVCRPDVCRDTATAIGQNVAVVLDGVGHMVPLEAPTRFAAIAGAFLALHGANATVLRSSGPATPLS